MVRRVHKHQDRRHALHGLLGDTRKFVMMEYALQISLRAAEERRATICDLCEDLVEHQFCLTWSPAQVQQHAYDLEEDA